MCGVRDRFNAPVRLSYLLDAEAFVPEDVSKFVVTTGLKGIRSGYIMKVRYLDVALLYIPGPKQSDLLLAIW